MPSRTYMIRSYQILKQGLCPSDYIYIYYINVGNGHIHCHWSNAGLVWYNPMWLWSLIRWIDPYDRCLSPGMSVISIRSSVKKSVHSTPVMNKCKLASSTMMESSRRELREFIAWPLKFHIEHPSTVFIIRFQCCILVHMSLFSPAYASFGPLYVTFFLPVAMLTN